MDYEEIARLIRRRRKELGISQKELAESAGISRATLSKIEKTRGLAKVKFSTLVRIVRELGYEFEVKKLPEENPNRLWTSEELWGED